MANEKLLTQYLNELHQAKREWAQLPIGDKITLFEQVLENTYQVAQAQTEDSRINKKIPEGSFLVGEEWLNGPTIQCRTLRLIIDTLKDIQKHGQPTIAKAKKHTLANGQLAVDVFPVSTIDSILFAGFKAQVWMQPGVNSNNLSDNMSSFFKEENPQGGVALVLGAGNVASIGPLDVVHKLIQGKVVILKMNPVNDYLGKHIEQAFKPFIDRGYLRLAYGGADVGEFLCQNDDVDEIHITGSDVTHDIICYGLGEQGKEAKRLNKPRLNKPITSELGNITPIIVVPGEWSTSQMQFHAENIATQLVNNAGFNCIAARVIVLHEQWPLKDTFMSILADTFAQLAPRKAYYPGAHDRYQAHVSANQSNAKAYGQLADENNPVPWTIIEDLDSEQDSVCFSKESFCGVIAQTSINANSVEQYLEKATTFCNDKLWGTLSACVIIDPKTQKKHQDAFEQTIRDLKYGAVGVNHWTGLIYGLGSTTWGAYPGHTWDNIQSGQGTVHNAFMFDKPQKSVLYGPFTTSSLMPFKPAWFASNTAMPDIAKALLNMERKPSWFKLPALIYATLKGVWQRHVTPFFKWLSNLLTRNEFDDANASKAKISPENELDKNSKISNVIAQQHKATPYIIRQHHLKSTKKSTKNTIDSEQSSNIRPH